MSIFDEDANEAEPKVGMLSTKKDYTLTKTLLQQALPKHLKRMASDELAEKIENISKDEEFAKNVRDNFISYTNILTDSRYSVEDYLNAVTYVSFKLRGYSNFDAYVRTFPDRYSKHVANGTTKKDIESYVSAYNRGKLVNEIFEQTMVPHYVLNQDAYQKAINTQVEIMASSTSDMARTQAANSILNHLKKPENTLIKIDIGTTKNKAMDDMESLIADLAKQQLELIKSGARTKDIVQQKIVSSSDDIEDADYTDVSKK